MYSNRTDYERAIYLLVEKARDGKLIINSELTINSLTNMRALPNNRIYLQNVDSLLRSMMHFASSDIFNQIDEEEPVE